MINDVPRRNKRVSLKVLQQQVAQERLLTMPDIEEDADLPQRPATRAECVNGARPCPFVSCKYHLYLDVDSRLGTIIFNFPGKEPEEIGETCALDVADRGGVTLDEVGAFLNVTRERIRQIEERCAMRIRDLMRSLYEVESEELRSVPHAAGAEGDI